MTIGRIANFVVFLAFVIAGFAMVYAYRVRSVGEATYDTWCFRLVIAAVACIGVEAWYEWRAALSRTTDDGRAKGFPLNKEDE